MSEPAARRGAGEYRQLERWSHTVAYVRDRNLDIVAATDVAQALHPMFRRGSNVARHLFLDPAAPTLHPDWRSVARQAVANLLKNTETRIHHPARSTTRLIGELSLRSTAFRTLWAAGDRAEQRSGIARFDLPLLGLLALDYEQLPVVGSRDSRLLVLHPRSGNAGAGARRLFTALHADQHELQRKDQL